MEKIVMFSITDELSSAFEYPRTFVAVSGDDWSEQVLAVLAGLLSTGDYGCETVASQQELAQLWGNGASPETTVLLFDGDAGNRRHGRDGCFQYRTRGRQTMPDWSAGARWGVAIGSRCQNLSRATDCASQIRASFVSHFANRTSSKWYPWGPPKQNESLPTAIRLPDDTGELIARLNDGPDLAASIAETSHAAELPAGSKISWFRVPPRPFTCKVGELTKLIDLTEQFEAACCSLADSVQDMLLTGVELLDDRLRDAYLNPPQAHLSARRLDLHVADDGVFASENDEMPGGFADACFLDWRYGVNQERWDECFDWLTESGKLVLLVSHERCVCYLPEMQWFVEYLRQRDFDVDLVTTDAMDELQVSDSEVTLGGSKVGSIWRLFPTYETSGKLVDIVLAAQRGLVRLVPEFGHYCAKAWYAVFRTHRQHYVEQLGEDAVCDLEVLLPDTRLVRWDESDFPCRVAGVTIDSFHQLRHLDQEQRNQLVLKVCGDNPDASRMYGVLMGRDVPQENWFEFLDEQRQSQQPFIIQDFRATEVMTVPVANTKTGDGEAFRCRLLARPWSVNGQLLTVPVFAIPSSSFRAHGRVDMGLAPVDLG